MKTKALLAFVLSLQGCAIAPDLKQTQIKGSATSQIAGKYDHFVEGVKKPNAIVCMVGLEAPIVGHWSNLEVVYLAEHYSLCNSKRDRGEERIGMGIIWRPFK